jgi:hypothetical protein
MRDFASSPNRLKTAATGFRETRVPADGLRVEGDYSQAAF